MEYEGKNLDHLGLVSATCEEIGLVEEIDKLIPPNKLNIVTVGECVLAMILNGLGFTSQPLYLTSHFFSDKPIEHLIRKGITAKNINDDVLGRALDSLFSAGCDKIFSHISANARRIFDVIAKFRHLDTTSMNVEGEYNSEEESLITFGYSKDGRSDLKQFMISLLVSNDGGIPMLAKTVAGNTSDKTHFREVLKELRHQIKDNEEEFYYVADCALYSETTIRELSEEKWITRVPSSINEVKDLKQKFSVAAMEELCDGYYGKEIISFYGGIQQRWLLVYSKQAYHREKKTLDKNIKKETENIHKSLQKLSKKVFFCEKDALKELKIQEKKFKYHIVGSYQLTEKKRYHKRGKPTNTTPFTKEYYIEAKAVSSEDKIKQYLVLKGKFVIATNELDTTKLNSIELLFAYKGQINVERGFRFLKDPLFMTSSVFLKNPERIVALGMIMCLCLLVYALAERKLRNILEEKGETVPNQKGKATNRPTMRWIFQIFQGVQWLIIKTEDGIQTIVLNLKEVHKHILSMLGTPYMEMYLIEG